MHPPAPVLARDLGGILGQAVDGGKAGRALDHAAGDVVGIAADQPCPPGKGELRRALRQRLLGALALRDVARDAQQAHRPAGAISHRVALDRDPAGGRGFAAPAGQNAILGPARGPGLPCHGEGRIEARQILRVHDAPNLGQRARRPRRVMAVDAAVALVAFEGICGQINAPDAQLGTAQGQPEALVAFAQGGLVAPALGEQRGQGEGAQRADQQHRLDGGDGEVSAAELTQAERRRPDQRGGDDQGGRGGKNRAASGRDPQQEGEQGGRRHMGEGRARRRCEQGRARRSQQAKCGRAFERLAPGHGLEGEAIQPDQKRGDDDDAEPVRGGPDAPDLVEGRRGRKLVHCHSGAKGGRPGGQGCGGQEAPEPVPVIELERTAAPAVHQPGRQQRLARVAQAKAERNPDRPSLQEVGSNRCSEDAGGDSGAGVPSERDQGAGGNA